jgi:pantothenate kinase type III
MSSVAPKAAADLEKAIKRPIFKVAPQAQNFIKGFHPEYGADRVADTVAARKFYAPNQNLAVFALGTCTVLTTVLANGTVGGGFIALGYHRMVAELQIASPLADTVKEADYRKYSLDFGFNTNDQIMNGAALAQIGIVERWLKLAKEKLGEPLMAVATGGNAVLLVDQKNGVKKLIDHIDPHLTIKGIYLIANQ